MSKKTWHIPAVDLIGKDSLINRLRAIGYQGDLENTMRSWVKRRRVPYSVREHIRELAHERKLRVDSSDFEVQRLPEVQDLPGEAA